MVILQCFLVKSQYKSCVFSVIVCTKGWVTFVQNYIMLTFAAILLAINVVLHKLYQERSGTSFAAVSNFNAFTGLLSAIAFWAINGFKIAFSPYSLIMAVIMTAFLLTCEVLGWKYCIYGGNIGSIFQRKTEQKNNFQYTFVSYRHNYVYIRSGHNEFIKGKQTLLI